MKNVTKGIPPKMPEPIVGWVHELIIRCLSLSPEKRPSFMEIFEIMKSHNYDMFNDVSAGKEKSSKQNIKEIENRILKIEWAKVIGELLDLSEQNFVDCVIGCHGCNGGDEGIAYDYVINKQQGMWNLQCDYPYTAIEGTCTFSSEKRIEKLRVTTTVTANEDELAAACERDGVASIAIDASNWSFQLYTSGIYNELACNAHKLNHAVLLGRFRFGKRCKILDR
ncbi:hypothetical protein M9Y10_010599 [Tritrichomonas musculus]|uniref:Peptidase C1A papain C-terminal domain-containing protein n=1 Tax=Tritrichomonas musculus TaxID=1915356 RepID=A0ABR2INQ1_9EUKA